MTDEQMLIDKYNITFVGSRRCYRVNLKEKEYTFEYSTPVVLRIYGQEIRSSSWNNLIYELAKLLNNLSPKSKEQLLAIKCDWGRQTVFSEKEYTNRRKFEYGLFINLNHTSVHAVWTAQLLLSEWGVNIDECELIIHRMPRGETKEVIDFYTQKNLEGYGKFLQATTSSNANQIDGTLKNLVNINEKIVSVVFKRSGNYNLLVIDDYLMYYNMKLKIMEYISFKYHYDDKLRRRCKAILESLGKYYMQELKKYAKGTYIFDG